MSITMTKDDDVSASTDDSQHSVATNDISMYDADVLKVIDDDFDAVRGALERGSWKFDATEISRSAHTILRQTGAIEKAELQMGSSARWTFTTYGEDAIEAVAEDTEAAEKVRTLSEYQIEKLLDHEDTIRALPADADTEWKAKEFGLKQGGIVGLCRADMIEIEEKHNNAANTYSVSDELAELKD